MKKGNFKKRRMYNNIAYHGKNSKMINQKKKSVMKRATSGKVPCMMQIIKGNIWIRLRNMSRSQQMNG